MKTFQDLMQEHPITVTQNSGLHVGTNDCITRWYNMHWGALTDTHCQLLDDGTYVVTGSRLSKEMWNQIMYNRTLRTAPGTMLPHCWYEVMNANHMESCFTNHNGQFAVAMKVSEVADNGELKIPMATSVALCQAVPGDACCGVC